MEVTATSCSRSRRTASAASPSASRVHAARRLGRRADPALRAPRAGQPRARPRLPDAARLRRRDGPLLDLRAGDGDGRTVYRERIKPSGSTTTDGRRPAGPSRFGKHPRPPGPAGGAVQRRPAAGRLRARLPVTPTELFFVRNHGDVPEVDPRTYRLTVDGLVRGRCAVARRAPAPARRSPSRRPSQCAGNRRAELIAVAADPGRARPGAPRRSATPTGTGVPLARRARRGRARSRRRATSPSSASTRPSAHGHRFGFGGSIPLDKALAPEVLLAYEMNGAAAAAGPRRPAARRGAAATSARAASSGWPRSPCRRSPRTTTSRRRPTACSRRTSGRTTWTGRRGLMLEDVNVNSVICSPRRGRDRGAPGGAGPGLGVRRRRPGVERVDLSGDGGRTWTTAELFEDRGRAGPGASGSAASSCAAGEHELVCPRLGLRRRRPSPRDPAQVWNFKGYMNNAWHRVRVTAG